MLPFSPVSSMLFLLTQMPPPASSLFKFLPPGVLRNIKARFGATFSKKTSMLAFTITTISSIRDSWFLCLSDVNFLSLLLTSWGPVLLGSSVFEHQALNTPDEGREQLTRL